MRGKLENLIISTLTQPSPSILGEGFKKNMPNTLPSIQQRKFCLAWDCRGHRHNPHQVNFSLLRERTSAHTFRFPGTGSLLRDQQQQNYPFQLQVRDTYLIPSPVHPGCQYGQYSTGRFKLISWSNELEHSGHLTFTS